MPFRVLGMNPKGTSLKEATSWMFFGGVIPFLTFCISRTSKLNSAQQNTWKDAPSRHFARQDMAAARAFSAFCWAKCLLTSSCKATRHTRHTRHEAHEAKVKSDGWHPRRYSCSAQQMEELGVLWHNMTVFLSWMRAGCDL